jgi:hypothetical protein
MFSFLQHLPSFRQLSRAPGRTANSLAELMARNAENREAALLFRQ